MWTRRWFVLLLGTHLQLGNLVPVVEVTFGNTDAYSNTEGSGMELEGYKNGALPTYRRCRLNPR